MRNTSDDVQAMVALGCSRKASLVRILVVSQFGKDLRKLLGPSLTFDFFQP